jgi:hypothetical protein
LFHLCIEVTLRLGIFSYAMMAVYVPFLPVAGLRDCIERIDRFAELHPGCLVWQFRMLQKGRWTVYFNGKCSFCRRWVARAGRTALPLVQWRDFNSHGAEVASLNPRFDRAAYLVIDQKMALPGFLGFRRLLLAMPLLWWMLPLVYLPGSRKIGEAVYRAISIRYGPVKSEQP